MGHSVFELTLVGRLQPDTSGPLAPSLLGQAGFGIAGVAGQGSLQGDKTYVSVEVEANPGRGGVLGVDQ